MNSERDLVLESVQNNITQTSSPKPNDHNQKELCVENSTPVDITTAAAAAGINNERSGNDDPDSTSVSIQSHITISSDTNASDCDDDISQVDPPPSINIDNITHTTECLNSDDADGDLSIQTVNSSTNSSLSENVSNDCVVIEDNGNVQKENENEKEVLPTVIDCHKSEMIISIDESTSSSTHSSPTHLEYLEFYLGQMDSQMDNQKEFRIKNSTPVDITIAECKETNPDGTENEKNVLPTVIDGHKSEMITISIDESQPSSTHSSPTQYPEFYLGMDSETFYAPIIKLLGLSNNNEITDRNELSD